MKKVLYLFLFVSAFASCRAVRQTAALNSEVPVETPQYLVGAVNTHTNTNTTTKGEEFALIEDTTIVETPVATTTSEKATVLNEISKKKSIQSFAQWKEMGKSGELTMSKKEMKMVNKLEKHYKGDYQKFRADTFEMTTKAKIIGGIGLLGLLLGIFTGSAFGWFLFILAAMAFLLRYLDIIAF